ncbi:hypothetical protein Misp03_69920 [Microbispora sp. NBRC 16548]|nr:hypothetical protein Misp03_69920 [Microbispora sp. NBRC 16548]
MTELAEETESSAYAGDEPSTVGDPAAMTPATAAQTTAARIAAARHVANGLNMNANYYAAEKRYSDQCAKKSISTQPE